MNTEYWDKLKKPPLTAMKTIQAGRLKGKSDINPQWRMQVMTETFGPCGVGWYYEITNKWLEKGHGEEICGCADVNVYIKTDGEWSKPIPGTGGSSFTTQEKHGVHTSDEVYKMAVTDALSVAFKALGVAAEIYLGNFDGSKYRNQPEETAGAQKLKEQTKRKDEVKDQINNAGSKQEVESIARDTERERLGWPKNFQVGMDKLIEYRISEFEAAEN